MLIYQRLIKSPLGNLLSLFSINGLCYLGFQDETPGFIQKYLEKHTDKMEWADKAEDLPKPVYQHWMDTIHWLKNYFQENSGKTHCAVKLPKLDFWGRAFEKKVWETLLNLSLLKVKNNTTKGKKGIIWNLSFGSTHSYGEIAEQMQHPLASRAVGRSVGNNPIALIIPCHRIMGSNGKLVGFRAGLKRKQWLLQHEGIVI